MAAAMASMLCNDDKVRFLWRINLNFAALRMQPTQSAQAVVSRGTLFYESQSGSRQFQGRLLALVLDRHKAHARSGRRLADGCRVGCVILAALAGYPVRRHQSRRHQLDRVSVLAKHRAQ